MNLVLERVNNVCRAVYQANREVTFKKLLSSIKSEFRKSDIDIIIKVKKDNKIENNSFYVEGWYDADDDKNGETPIELLVGHNFSQDQIFKENQTAECLIQIYDATVHELRHQYQSRKRKYKTYSNHPSEPYSSYLADPDEIDAYAFSIAIDLLRYMDASKARRYMTRITILGKMKNGPSLVSPNLRAYTQHFKGNPLLKRLSRKVLKHLETVDSTLIFR